MSYLSRINIVYLMHIRDRWITLQPWNFLNAVIVSGIGEKNWNALNEAPYLSFLVHKCTPSIRLSGVVVWAPHLVRNDLSASQIYLVLSAAYLWCCENRDLNLSPHCHRDKPLWPLKQSWFFQTGPFQYLAAQPKFALVWGSKWSLIRSI